IPVRALADITGLKKIVRMIPNAPSIVGEGYNPVAFSPGISKSEAQEFLKLLKPLGDSPEVEEDKLEAYAIVTAMGPTYLWFQLAELNELAKSFGLSEKEAAKAISKMAKGAIKTLFDSGLDAAEVINLVPAKPLAEDEPVIRNAYRSRLTSLYGKLKG
ncbi:MAG: pyrroline-5-carboxylate reductase, partial [Syntrophaceae bacterium]